MTVSKSFTALGNGLDFRLPAGQSATWSVSGSFTGTVVLEHTRDGGSTYQPVEETLTAPGNGVFQHSGVNNSPAIYRWRCSVFGSGTIVTSLADASDPVLEVVDADGETLIDVNDGSVDTLIRKSQKKIITSGAKVGGTAGWLIDAANDKGSMAKCPAAETAATMVVKIPDLKVGDVITAFGVNGQLESGGNVATLDAVLRAQTAVAAAATDASVGAITQVSETSDAIIAAEKTGLSHTVLEGNSYYMLLTATTAASTDIDLLNVSVTVTEK